MQYRKNKNHCPVRKYSIFQRPARASFFQKGTKEFGRSKSCKFFDPKRKAVVGPPDPAAQDHPVTAGSHGKNDQRIFDDQVSAYKKTGAHLFIQNNRTVLFVGVGAVCTTTFQSPSEIFNGLRSINAVQTQFCTGSTWKG